jgi:hypothetical protein
MVEIDNMLMVKLAGVVLVCGENLSEGVIDCASGILRYVHAYDATIMRSRRMIDTPD